MVAADRHRAAGRPPSRPVVFLLLDEAPQALRREAIAALREWCVNDRLRGAADEERDGAARVGRLVACTVTDSGSTATVAAVTTAERSGGADTSARPICS